jgi:hypothetical protein
MRFAIDERENCSTSLLGYPELREQYKRWEAMRQQLAKEKIDVAAHCVRSRRQDNAR